MIPVVAAAGVFSAALLADQPLGAALDLVAAEGLTLDLPANDVQDVSLQALTPAGANANEAARSTFPRSTPPPTATTT